MAAKRLKASERKEEIIKAAIKVVAKSNFDRATIAEIAKQAKINEALIYQHFSSKNELMLALLDYIRDRMSISMLATKELQDPSLGALRKAGVNYYESARINVDMLKCIQCSTTVNDKQIKEKALQHLKFFQKVIRNGLNRAMENNFIDSSFDLEILAWGILGITWMLSLALMLGEPQLMPVDRLNEVYERLEALLKPQNNSKTKTRRNKK